MVSAPHATSRPARDACMTSRQQVRSCSSATVVPYRWRAEGRASWCPPAATAAHPHLRRWSSSRTAPTTAHPTAVWISLVPMTDCARQHRRVGRGRALSSAVGGATTQRRSWSQRGTADFSMTRQRESTGWTAWWSDSTSCQSTDVTDPSRACVCVCVCSGSAMCMCILCCVAVTTSCTRLNCCFDLGVSKLCTEEVCMKTHHIRLVIPSSIS